MLVRPCTGPLEARLCWCTDLYRNHEGAPWFTIIESTVILDTQAKDRMSVKLSSLFMSRTKLESQFLKHNFIGFSDTCNQEVMIEIVSCTCVCIYTCYVYTHTCIYSVPINLAGVYHIENA